MEMPFRPCSFKVSEPSHRAQLFDSNTYETMQDFMDSIYKGTEKVAHGSIGCQDGTPPPL